MSLATKPSILRSPDSVIFSVTSILPLIDTLPVTLNPDSSYSLISIYSTNDDSACIVVADNVSVIIEF